MNDQNISLPPLPEWVDWPVTVSEMTASEIKEAMQAYAREAIEPYAKRIAELEADRQRRGEPVAWPTHEFAIVVDRMYEGEGQSLAMWSGENYQFSDGDCYDRETDGSLDGYTAEWLTHHQLEQRLFAPQPAEPDLDKCAECGAEMIHVRPGKWQHPDCPQSPGAAEPVKDADIADVIAGHLQTSRAHAYELMEQALAQRGYPTEPVKVLSDADAKHVQDFINCDGMGAVIVEGPQYSAVVRALVARYGQSEITADEDAYVIDRLGKLLAQIAVIVKGPEPALVRWSYHDLPELVAKAISKPAASAEPVAWQLHLPDGRVTLEKSFPAWADGGDGYAIRPLFAAPVAAQAAGRE